MTDLAPQVDASGDRTGWLPRPAPTLAPALRRLHGLEAVLLDAGDILYDRASRGAALAEFLRGHGVERPVDKAAVRPAKRAAWLGETSRDDYFRALLATAGVTDPALLDEGTTWLVAAQQQVRIRPDVAESLHALRRAGYRLAIVTNTHEPTAEKLGWFADAGLDRVWDAFVTSCEVGLVKPDPAIYHRALDVLGVPPEAALFVGHAAAEIAGAREAGLATAAFNPDAPDIGADLTLDRLDDLLALARPGPAARDRAKGFCPGPAGLPIVAAHRGGAGLWPENSMTAFRAALQLRVDMIETDVHLSGDGVPVLLHDAMLDRTTNASGPVTHYSAAELATIPLRNAGGEGVATLDDLLALMASTPTDLRLEIKLGPSRQRHDGIEALVLSRLQRHGMLGRTTITSFASDILADLRPVLPSGRLLLLVRSDEIDADGLSAILSRAAQAGIGQASVPAHRLDAAAMATAAEVGVRLGAYGVNDTADIDRIIALGAVAFTTDWPDLALDRRRTALAQRLRADSRDRAVGPAGACAGH